MGGVGKTTLAQYVFNDKRVEGYFNLRLWVSATQHFDVKDVLQQIMACINTYHEKAVNYEINQLKGHLLREMVGKRFLLVLDGVWDHPTLRSKWLELRALLNVGAQGSQVLLTTRSKTVAGVIGTQESYMVSPLGEDDSLLLLRHVAITELHEPEVVPILQEIAKMCPKVPLFIRAIGSILAEKPTVQEWRAFRNDKLANIALYGPDIIGTLKLSYDHLDPQLRLCVASCSLFPKGFVFGKNLVIHLWIAMGYVVSKYTDQSLEEAAEEYVSCLLNRGFFYSIDRVGNNKCPDVFQMNDLMHDIALSIAGIKYKMADSDTSDDDDFDESLNHVSFDLPPYSHWEPQSSLFRIKHLKSFLLPFPNMLQNTEPIRVSPLKDILFISRIKSLRTLRMNGVGIRKLPKSLGKLIHLRYLDFSNNPIRKLPDSITQLLNLYLLDLSFCRILEELPEEISKLADLKHLYLFECDSMSHIPKGLQRLTGLETLDYFVVGKPKSAFGLADLSCLNNLKGLLTIVLVDRSKDIDVSEAKAANLNKKEITRFVIKFRGSGEEDEAMLENLLPGPNLELLVISKYGGKRLPCWMREGLHLWLQNLVDIRIMECKECIYICSFGSLPLLKYLTLESLDKVHYIEDGSSDNMAVIADNQTTSTLLLFESLEYLHLVDIPKLEGWRNDTRHGLNKLEKWMPAFPKLKEIKIDMELVISFAKLFPQGIPSVRTLKVIRKSRVTANQTASLLVNAPVALATQTQQGQVQPQVGLLKPYLPKLRDLYFGDGEMKVIPEEFRGMSSLECLHIWDGEALEEVPEWIDGLTSLEHLCINNCPKLKSLPRKMCNLSNLESLYILECSEELAQRCKKPSGEDWCNIQHIPIVVIEESS